MAHILKMSNYEYSDEEFIYSDDDGDEFINDDRHIYSVDMENAFYEAEDVRRNDPERAVQLFSKVVAMEKV